MISRKPLQFKWAEALQAQVLHAAQELGSM
jgi:hypothetical protein